LEEPRLDNVMTRMMPHHPLKNEVQSAMEHFFSPQELSDTLRILDTEESSLSLRRILTSSKFEAFNMFLKALTVHVPPITDVIADLPRPFTQVLIDITEMKCFNMALYDANVKFVRIDAKEIRPTINLSDIAVDCTFNWNYNYDAKLLGWVQGSGSAILQFHQADLTTTMAIKSPTTLELEFPTQVDVLQCGADFQIKDMTFFGSVQANMADSFEGKVRETVKTQANEAVCEKIMSLDADLDTMVKLVATSMSDVLKEFDDGAQGEDSMTLQVPSVPDDVTLFDFSQENMFTSLLDRVRSVFYVGDRNQNNVRRSLQAQVSGNRDGGFSLDEMLSGISLEGLTQMLTTFASATGEEGAGGLDVNQLIREKMLDYKGLFDIPMAGMLLFEGLDEFMETEVTFASGKIKGLDSISELTVLEVVGPQQLRNKVALDNIEIEIDLKIKTKAASTSEFLQWDPQVAGDQPAKLVTLKTGASGISVDFMLFLGIDQGYIQNTTLGTLLMSDSIATCAINAIYALKLSDFAAGIVDVKTPTIDGFDSPGINQLLTETVDGMFMLVKQFVLSWTPLVFETEIKAMVNSMIENFLKDTAEGNSCANYDPDTIYPDYLDLRDLLLTPENAKAFGGSGSAPYGTLMALAKQLLDDQVFAVSPETGLSLFNEYAIAPLTIANSGTSGTFVVQEPLINQSSIVEFLGLNGTFHIAVSGPKVENLDSFGKMAMLNPMDGEKHRLDNHMKMAVAKLLKADTNLVVSFQAADEGVHFHNEVNLSIAIKSAEAIATLLAKVDASVFMGFPLGNALNPDCWIASLFPLNFDGGYESSSHQVFGVRDVLLSLQELMMDIECVNCSSEPLRNLSVVNATRYTNRALKYTVDMLSDGLLGPKLKKLRLEAMSKCFSTENDDNPSLPSNNDFGIPIEVERTAGGTSDTPAALSEAEENTAENNAGEDGQDEDGQDEDGDEVRYFDFAADNWVNTIIGKVRDILNFESGASGSASAKSAGVVRLLQQMPGLDLDLGSIDFSGGDGLDINSVIQSLLLDNEGVLQIPLENMVLMEETDDNLETRVVLQGVKIRGLDTIQELSVFDVLDPHTLRNRVTLGNLRAEVELSLQTALDAGVEAAPVTQNITITVNLTGVSLEADMFVGIDASYVEGITLGTLLTSDDLLGCAFAAVHQVKIENLNATLGRIETPVVEGIVPTELNEFLNDSLDIVFTILESFFQDWISHLASQDLKNLANGFIQDFLDSKNQESLCPKYDASSLDEYIDFRDMLLMPEDAAVMGASGTAPYGTLFATAKRLLHNQVFAVDPNTGLSKMNDLVIAPMTERQSSIGGTFVLENDVINQKNRIDVPGLEGEFEFRISDVYVENLDSVGTVAVLNPRSSAPHTLDNHAEVAVANRPIRASTRMALGFQGETINFRNEIDLSLVMEAAELTASVMARINSQRLMDFPLGDVTNMHCWLSTIPAPKLDKFGVRLPGETPTTDIEDFHVTFGELTIGVDCLECSSPKLQELSTSNATDFGRNVFQMVEDLVLGNYTQVEVDRFLTNAALKCPHRQEQDGKQKETQFGAFQANPNSSEESGGSFLAALLSVLACAVGILVIIMLTMRFIIGRKHKRYMASLSNEDQRILLTKQTIVEEERTQIDETTTSMCCSKQLSLFVRIIMPFVILANIALFLSGHLSLGAAVTVDLEFAGEPLTLNNFFLFSMARSTGDMWKAGANELAIFIIIFSGLWPYTKQIITLVLWFCPPSRVSVRRRGSIYQWLDTLAKWSMVDIFVLVISLVAFRIAIQSPSDAATAFLDLYEINIMIVPMWGLYANMIAQLVSQVSSHFIVHYHAKIVNEARKSTQSFTSDEITGDEDDADICEIAETGVALARPVVLVPQPLYRHTFRVSRSSKGKVLRVREWVNYVLPLIAVTTIAVTVVGCAIPSFQLEILGLLGIAVEFGQSGQEAISQYSVIKIVQTLFSQAAYLGTASAFVGLGTLAILFSFSVLVVPILQVSLLLFMWFGTTPPETKLRNRAVWGLEILRAWQYVEVYLFSIIIATWQIGGISQFFFDDVAGDSMTGILEALVNFGLIDSSDARLFYVSSQIRMGTYFLVVASILLWTLDEFVSRADKQQRLEIEDASRYTDAAMKAANIQLEDCPDDDVRSKVKPLRILFTDCFRWFLHAAPGANAADLQCSPSMDCSCGEEGAHGEII
jgi:hypothetical protein